MQDKTEGKFFFQRLQTPSAESNLLPELSRICASPARHLWQYLFNFWPLVQTGRDRTVGSPRSSSTPHLSEGVG